VRSLHPRALGTDVLRGVLWATLIPVLRGRARRRLRSLTPGRATIVTVNWNSARYLAVLLDLVEKRSPDGTEIIVVDNASRDDTRAVVARHPAVRLVRFPTNVGHEIALDTGFLLARTEYVVALDVDAFPLHDRWLAELTGALQSGAEVAGARLNRQYVHPCCLAMRASRFVERGHSFRANYVARTETSDASGDVGEAISAAEHDRVRFFDVTSQRGPGDVGTVFGDLVYHNFYSTRFRATTDTVLDVHVTSDAAATAWDEAVVRYGAPPSA
jgi:glycosyltransferase involved in cell wall biosynthesis